MENSKKITKNLQTSLQSSNNLKNFNTLEKSNGLEKSKSTASAQNSSAQNLNSQNTSAAKAQRFQVFFITLFILVALFASAFMFCARVSTSAQEKTAFSQAESTYSTLANTPFHAQSNTALRALADTTFQAQAATPFRALAETAYYARIESASAQLYSAPSELAALCTLPQTYYVKLDGTKSGNFYAVTYNGAHGYVKADTVTIVDGTPQAPYYTPTLSNWTATTLRPTAAESSSDTLAATPISSGTLLCYIGQKIGATVHDNVNLWYYVSLPTGQIGYVFSGTCNLLPTQVPPCPEANLPALTTDIFAQSTAQEFSTLTTGTKILLIVAIAVPSALILYFLVKPTKLAKLANGKNTTAKKARKPRRHGDYFEFDENEL